MLHQIPTPMHLLDRGERPRECAVARHGCTADGAQGCHVLSVLGCRLAAAAHREEAHGPVRDVQLPLEHAVRAYKLCIRLEKRPIEEVRADERAEAAILIVSFLALVLVLILVRTLVGHLVGQILGRNPFGDDRQRDRREQLARGANHARHPLAALAGVRVGHRLGRHAGGDGIRRS